MLFGIGYDIHRLVENRKLILGGVEFDYPLGLLGHSDADVVLHAICDALLGAAALGDIGEHFPDTDPKWKGVSSKVFLLKVIDLLKEHRCAVNNVDVTILAQRPKLGQKKIRDEKKYCGMALCGYRQDQYQGNDNGRCRCHWTWRGYCSPGHCKFT